MEKAYALKQQRVQELAQEALDVATYAGGLWEVLEEMDEDKKEEEGGEEEEGDKGKQGNEEERAKTFQQVLR